MLFVYLPCASASSVAPEVLMQAKKEYPTEVLLNLWEASLDDKTAVSKFFNSLTEKHIIEAIADDPDYELVTYFAMGSDVTDYIMQSGGPDFYGLRFKRLGTTNLYFCIQKIPSDAMFNYGFNEFTRKLEGDSNVLAVTSMKHIYDGSLAASKALKSPYVELRSKTPKGKLLEKTFNSKFMGESRETTIYLPPNYDANITHNLVIQFDGQNFLSAPDKVSSWQGWTPLPTIMDNLLEDQKVPPTIVVFIKNHRDRSASLISDKITDFVALEVVPWLRKNYNISNDPLKAIISGPSRAGFAAVNTAFRHSSIVGSVLSQSGSFYYTLQEDENWPIYPEHEGKLLMDLKHSDTRPIRFHLSVGLYDLGLGAVGTNRQLRDILELKGYWVDYDEYKGGHSHLNWRNNLHKGLISLLND